MTATRSWLAPTLLALLLLGALVPAAVSSPLPETRAALRHVVRDTLGEADQSGADAIERAGALLPRPLLPRLVRDESLEALATFTQPAVRGQDDLLAAVWIAPTASSWSGAYWIESEAGMVTPRTLTVGREGALLAVYGGSLALTDALHVTFHFLGPNGTAWAHAAPSIDVLDATPTRDRVDLGGALATRHGRADAPELVFFTPWNVLDHEVRMGYTLLDDAGEPLETTLVGGCADASAEMSEAGCRPLYIVARGAARTLVLWQGVPTNHGGSLYLEIEDIAQKPYVFR